MRIKRGTIPVIAGLLLMAAALFLTVCNLREGQSAGDAADRVVAQITQTAPQVVETPEILPLAPELPIYERYPDMEMPAMAVDGEEYIGLLRIPALELELPVMKDWSYLRLKTAPCRYSGSVYQENLVVMAHNYDRHFGPIKNLEVGDEVLFTDMDGNRFRFRVGAVEALEPADIEGMTGGEWPLTLFTCTVGGQYRIAVRCGSAEDG